MLLKLSLKLSLVLFIIFFANVFWASQGGQEILSDVQELLVLCASVVLFVVGILHAEASK